MTTEDIPNYYAEFGIDRTATAGQVSVQLDRAVRTWASRASRAPDAKKRREAEDKLELISQARKELLDHTRRRAYDRALDRARRTPEPVPEPAADPAPEPVPDPEPQPTPRGRDWVGHARSLMSQGNSEGALYELRQAVHYDDGNGDAWRLLGAMHANQGLLKDALQEFQRALALHPGDALTHSLIAHVYEQFGDVTTAADWHLAAARLAPTDTDSRVTAAHSLYQAGRYDEALNSYEEALAGRPEDAALRDQIGRIWSLRAEGAMVWHPIRKRYVVASEISARTVTHCAEQGLAVGISDTGLLHRLSTYRADAGKALRRTWVWYKSMAAVMVVCLVLMSVLPTVLGSVFLAGFFVLPIVMGIKPRWRHTHNHLPSYQRPQTWRVP